MTFARIKQCKFENASREKHKIEDYRQKFYLSKYVLYTHKKIITRTTNNYGWWTNPAYMNYYLYLFIHLNDIKKKNIVIK